MANGRIHGLDTARAALLFLGVVSHGAVFSRWSGPTDRFEFEWMLEIIRSFRMPAFFAVAGYLMAIALPRRPQYLRNRLRQLLVPVLFTWLLVLPVSWTVTSGSPMWQPNDLSILWFLVALSGATCIVFWSEKVGWNARLLDLTEKIPLLLSGLVFFLIVYVTATIVGTVQWKLHLGASLASALLRIVDCTPFLVLGFCMCRSERPRGLLQHPVVRWIGPVALIAYATHFAIDHQFYIGDRPLFERVFSRGVVTLVSITMTLTVLAWSGRLNTKNALANRMSAAAFTIYLFHMSTMDVLYAITRGWHPYVQFLLFVPLTAVICYGIHQLISRSPLLLFMFNGRPFPTRARKVQPAE